MSSVGSKISDDIKSALKEGDKERVAALRFISAALKQKEVDGRRELSDDEAVAVLMKMAKQHRESMACYKDAGRDELYDREKYELDQLSAYLPAAADESEVDALIERVIAEQKPEGVKGMGAVMAALKSSLHGRADMGAVGAKVRERLSR